MHGSIKVGLVASFLLLLTTNVVLIDLFLVLGRRTASPSQMASTTVRLEPTPPPDTSSCPAACMASIAALDRNMKQLESRVGSENTTPFSTANSDAREYYIPLGSGSTTSNSWKDIPGVEAVIDTGNYPRIKSVTFEAYLNIPTANGRVYAKVFNVTDKHDVWFSELNAEGPVLVKKEASISLENGIKTYRVMGLSTLKYEANIQNARLKILTY